VAIVGTLGLLPSWVTSKIELHKGHSVNWLLNKLFLDKTKVLKVKVDAIFAKHMHSIEDEAGLKATFQNGQLRTLYV
jgi:hypothetical protein